MRKVAYAGPGVAEKAMRLAWGVLLVLGGAVPVAGQDRPEPVELETVLRKIEARAEAVRALTAEIRIGFPEDEQPPGDRYEARVEFVAGEFLRKRVGLWSPRQGFMVWEEYYSKDVAACRGIAFARGKTPLFFAAKTRPGAGSPLFRTPVDEMVLLLGTDAILLDVLLFPRKILALTSGVKVVRSGRNLVLSGSREYGGERFIFQWWFERETLRLERAEVRAERQKLNIAVIRPSEYARVNGVELPVRFEMPLGGMGRIGFRVKNLRSVEPADLRPAGWLNDPALPDSFTGEPAELLMRLKNNPNDGRLAMMFANAAARGLLEGGAVGPVHEALEGALKGTTGSALLRAAAYCARLAAGKVEQAGRLYEKIAACDEPAPEAHLVCAAWAYWAGKFPQALEAVRHLPEAGIYADLASEIRFGSLAGTAKTPEDFERVVREATEGLGIREQLSRLVALEPPLTDRRGTGVLSGRDEAFIGKVAASESRLLRLLAARAFAHRDRPDRAAELLEDLAGDAHFSKFLIEEIQEFCKAATGVSKGLLRRMEDRLTDPGLLLSLSTSAMEQGDEKRFARVFDRLVNVLEMPENRGSSYRDPEKVMPLLQRLVAAGRTAQARELLLAYADEFNAEGFLWGGSARLVRRVLGKDKEALYRFARLTGMRGGSLKALGLDVNAALEMIRTALEGEAPRAEDGVALSLLFLGRGGADPAEFIPLFETATKRWPDRAVFHERLGDARLLAGRFGEAIPAYRRAIEKSQVGPPDVTAIDPLVVRARALRGPPSKEDGFDLAAPIIVKLAIACKRHGDIDGGVRAVEEFLEKYPGRRLRAAEAYGELGKVDRQLALHKANFLEARKGSPPGFGWPGMIFEQGIELGRLYMAYGRWTEAFVMSLLLEELSKRGQGEEVLEQVRALSRQVREKFGEEDLVRAFLKEEFDALSEAEIKVVRRLIRDLDADDPATREKASAGIREVGPKAAPLLGEARKDAGLEVQDRIRAILVEMAKAYFRSKFETSK